MIFFCCLYDYNGKDIYKIQIEKTKEKEQKKGEEKEEKIEQVNNTEKIKVNLRQTREIKVNLKRKGELKELKEKNKQEHLIKEEKKVIEKIKNNEINQVNETEQKTCEEKINEIKTIKEKVKLEETIPKKEQERPNKIILPKTTKIQLQSKEIQSAKQTGRNHEIERIEIAEQKKEITIKKEKEEIKEGEETEKVDKNLLKCKLMNFCGTLELDGAFKYIGEKIELKIESLVIVLSEYLYRNNINIKNYAEKYEAKGIIEKIKKNKNNPLDFNKILKNNKIIKNIDIEKENIEEIKKKYGEMANKEILCNEKMIIKTNDLVLIENKREYPNNMSNEINNFIEHSLYFISLYKNLKLLDDTSEIHLLFVYDHSRNYNDERQAVKELYNIINESYNKLDIIKNKIKFYLIHSLPNLSISIYDTLNSKINYLTNQNNTLLKMINELNNKMDVLKKEINNLKFPNNKKKNCNKKNWK